MDRKSTNIVWHETKVKREDRHRLNGHQSCVLWFTGLSGSGKSSIAMEVEKQLHQRKIRTYVLDGDNIRHGLNRDLGFSSGDRKENIRRIGEVSRLLVDAGMIALTAFISPYQADRQIARELFTEGDFIEIYVKCSLEECERRDPKGLYKKARKGEIRHFTGITDPYEPPVNPEILIESDKQPLRQSAAQIIQYLQAHGYLE